MADRPTYAERGVRLVPGLLVGAMLVVAQREGWARAQGPSPAHELPPLLDVPYVSQTPELCGGAAVAMVLRYWGERDVFPRDFASLVSASDGGILTGTLASAVRGRGWQALVTPAAEVTGPALIRSEIDRGRPLIALIEVEPRIYHYVVIVGGTEQQVVFHDPARAPFRVLTWAQFERAWAGTSHWMMLVLPPIESGSASAPSDARSPDPLTPCTPLVERGVQQAIAGDRDGAEQVLQAATAICPTDSDSWRELAGLRFSQSRWAEAQDVALVAARLAPEDAGAWQIVATSRYLMGDMAGALAAWNRTGAPRIDTLNIHGAGRTRQPVIARAAGLQPRQVLTPGLFGRAQRRIDALPVAANVRVKYEPVFTAGGALAGVDVFLNERPVVPRGWSALGMLAARALLLGEIRVDVAGPLGAGEVESAAWRWSPLRPRVAFGLALPSPQWFLGTVSLDVSWERQSYESTSSFGDTVRRSETRRRVAVQVADWSSSWLRWQTGGALDRLPISEDGADNRQGARDYLAVESALDARLARDRLALAASAGWWTPFAGGPAGFARQRFAAGELLMAWRSTADASIPSWSAMTALKAASAVAPLALWNGAGTGKGRSGLLRAHPLLNNDVISGTVFGRQVTHGSFEHVRPVRQTIAGGLAVAVFVDAARASRGLSRGRASPLLVDAGLGLRMRPAGSRTAIRIDLAHGLRGGGTTLSAGWQEEWPR